MNTSNNQSTKRKLQFELKKFLDTHKQYFKAHTFTYHAFQKNNALDLWEAIKAFGGTKKVRKEFKLELPCHHEKWKKKQLINELWKIHRTGNSITKTSLINSGRSELLSISRQFGTFSSIKREMGFKAVEKTFHTREDVLNTYRELYIRLGGVPTRSFLLQNGHTALTSRIRTHFGSVTALKKKLKIPATRKPNKYWTLRNTLKELNAFYNMHAEEINRSSMHRVLAAKNQLSLINAIGRWKGLSFLNEKYGLNIPIAGKKWNKEKVLSELTRLHADGHNLSITNIRKIGCDDLAGVIYKYGRLSKFREQIGAQGRRYGYWNKDTIREELMPIIKQFSCIPSHNVLKSMNRHDLVKAIVEQGGSAHFAKLLNVPIRTLHEANDGHFLQSSYECIFDNILSKHNIPHRVHVLVSPDYRYKCDFLIQKTYVEITGYFRKGDDTYIKNLKKKIRLYKKLEKKHIIIPRKVFLQRPHLIENEVLFILSDIRGLKKKTRYVDNDVRIMPKIYWTDPENIKKELWPLIQEYDRMPRVSELKKLKKHGLISAVNKYHDSLFELAKKWNVKTDGVPQGYYTKKRIMEEYNEASLSQRRALSGNEVRLLGFIDLANAIVRTKCIKNLRKNLERQFPDQIACRPPGYTIRKAMEDYKRLCETEQRFLTLKEICGKGFSRLAGFIQKRKIGIYRLRKMTKLPYSSKSLPIGYYSEKTALSAYTKICREKGYFLTGREARLCMPPKLVAYIEYTLGFKLIRKKTGLKFVVNINRPKISVEEAVGRYREICIREKYQVTIERLVQLGEGKLARFILKEIKYPIIKKMIGLDLPFRSPAHNLKYKAIYARRREKKKRMTIEAYERICLKQKRNLSIAELRDFGMRWVANASRTFGGMPGLRRYCKKTSHLRSVKVGRRRKCLNN